MFRAYWVDDRDLADDATQADRYNAHDGALVSMDPRNGAVVAMVGAWDPNNAAVGQLNMATRPLQPGSTIKVFTYTTAIATRRFTMTTPIVDGPIRLELQNLRSDLPAALTLMGILDVVRTEIQVFASGAGVSCSFLRRSASWLM